MKNILVIRLSSIGDIVICSPVLRALKQQLNARVTMLTKKGFVGLNSSNPYVDEVLEYEASKKQDFSDLKEKEFDCVVDLHKNIRSKQVAKKLKKKVYSFSKLNVDKWILVNFKLDRLPNIHLVDRYFEGLQELGITNDGMGLDFFYNANTALLDRFDLVRKNYVVIAIGAALETKSIPVEKIVEIVQLTNHPVVLIGGPSDKDKAKRIVSLLKDVAVKNLVGEISIDESAQIIDESQVLVTPDTGMMHIGAALKKSMVVLWGNTTPKFGMFPYYGNSNVDHVSFEQSIACRPCSKIGYSKCPKVHFNCMNNHRAREITHKIDALIP